MSPENSSGLRTSRSTRPGSPSARGELLRRDVAHTASDATVSTSAATDGRSEQRSSQAVSAGYAVEREAHQVAQAEEPREVGDVREAERPPGEERRRRERPVEIGQHVVEPLGRALAAPERVVRLAEVVEAEHEQPRDRPLAGVGRQERRLRVALLEVLVDHDGLGQHPAVLLEHGDAPVGRVVLEEPGRPVARSIVTVS